MAVKEENKRISLTLSKELDEKIDRLAGLQNISKNATIVNLIEMSIDAQISVWNIMKDPQLFNKLMDSAIKIGDSVGYESLKEAQKIMTSDKPEDKKIVEETEKLYESIK